MDSKDSSKNELEGKASQDGAVVSAIKEFVEVVKVIVVGSFFWLVTLVALLAGGALGLVLWLITLAIPIGIVILIALWAYKTFLAD